MTFNLHKSQVHTIRQGDPKFNIVDGFVTYPRAMLHVTPDCPSRYKDIIAACVDNGWIKPVANVTEREMIFIGLGNE